MKKIISAILFLLILIGCEKDLNEIDTNPNYPLDVTIDQLIPTVTTGVPYYVNGTELAWYTSVFVEHTTGTYLDMRSADRRTNINSQLGENAWKTLYTNVLMNLNTIIEKGSTGGSEEGNWKYVGMAQVLFAYTMSAVTDLWGRVPYSEAFQGSDNRKPKYDKQQDIYNALFNMLDQAVNNLDKESLNPPGNEDFIYSGDTDKWKQAAWAVKAKLYNHLSNIDAQKYSQLALNCIDNSFQSSEDDMAFDAWGGTTDKDHQNPWYRESQERSQLSVSKTFYDLLNDLDDPRSYLYFTTIGGSYSPASNGSAKEDPSDLIYSKISSNVVYYNAPIPLITFVELKFIEAECHFRLNQNNLANYAYEQAVIEDLKKAGVSSSDIVKYTTDADVFPGQNNISLNHIITQKYVALWPYNSIEAYTDWRRTGIPQLNNPLSEPPLRFPYPQTELSANGENVPNASYTDGVWWDDGTED